MRWVIFTFLVIAACSIQSFAKYSGGSGEPNAPYQIANVADFNQLTHDPNNWYKVFILTSDINLAGVSLTPVGNSTIGFTGIFDGNSHVISNADINQPSVSWVGLFGYISTSGQIKNLDVENATITGRNNIGGLVGENHGNIINCYSNGQVSGSEQVGGLVGANNSGGSISNCYSMVKVSGSSPNIGGLVGENGGSISNCYSMGKVSSSSSNIGGLVGYNSPFSSISDCYSMGQVSGSSNSQYVGGLVGWNSGSISNCYSTEQVSGSSYLAIGGLVGENGSGGSVSNCYSTGQVSGSHNFGGLMGLNYGSVVGSFWDIQTSGQATSAGGTGETTAEMKTKSTFASAGWDFTNTWSICEVTNYPRLIWQIPVADFVCPDGVDFVDYAFFAGRWLNTNCAANNNCDGADFDLSGTVDIADLKVFCGYWLQSL